MLQIRPAALDDVTNVLAFWTLATEEPSSTDDAASVGALIEQAPTALLLAFDDGTLVGSVIAGWDGWRGSMYRLAVAPEHRRRRVATALVAAAEDSLRVRGAKRLHLIVTSRGGPAQTFWESAGYARTEQSRFVKTF